MKKQIFTLSVFTILMALFTISHAQNVVADTSFEGGTPSASWTEASTNFGTPICDLANCGNCGGGCVAKSGSFYVWFGGVAAFEEGSLTQSVTIPSGTAAYLRFWLTIPNAANTGNDSVAAFIDNIKVWGASDRDSATYQTYQQVMVDVTPFANGASHTLKMWSVIQGTPALSNFIVDDVTLDVTTNTGVVSNLLSEGISIYPNPTNNMLYVDLNLRNEIDMQVEMYSLAGALVYQKSLDEVQYGKLKINVSDMASGNYILKLRTPQKVITKNVSVTR